MSEIIIEKKTKEIFDEIIHPKLKKKLKLEDDKSVEKEQQDAEFLEESFNIIKKVLIGDLDLEWAANLSVGRTGKGISAKAIKELSKIINQDVVKDLNKAEVFKYIGAPRYGENQGEAFEYDLALIIGEILNSLTDQKINFDSFLDTVLTGKTSASLLNNKNFSAQQAAQLMGVTVEQFNKLTKHQISGVFKIAKGPFYNLVGRSGVVDIDIPKGTANIKYTFDESPYLKRLFKILTGATFSAKNYLLDSLASGIKLGLADKPRFISSVLSYLNFSAKDIGNIAARIYNYEKDKTKSDYNIIMNHLRHLRFAYELMGVGQSTGQAKFLIINQRMITGTAMWELQKTLKTNFFKDTKRGDIRVFSNRWLIKKIYNVIIEENNNTKNFLNKTGNIIFINNIE